MKSINQDKKRKSLYLGPAGRALLRLFAECMEFATSSPSQVAFAARTGLGFVESNKILRRIEDRRRFAYLKKKKIIKERMLGDRMVIELTVLGRQLLIQQNIVNKKKRLPKGELCLISFDIPERERHARVALRKFLKIKKFKLLQKSVWASDEDMFEEIISLVCLLKIQDWVSVFMAIKKV